MIFDLQRSQLIDDFEARLDELSELLLAIEYDTSLNQPCPCDSGALCTVQCRDCTGYGTRCEECFISMHMSGLHSSNPSIGTYKHL